MLHLKKINKCMTLKVIFLIILSFILSSCRVLPPKPVVNEINVNLKAEKNVNPNEFGQAAPINIFIYGVKSVDVFKNSDFFETTENKNPDGQAVAKKIYDGILKPGEKRTVVLKLNKENEALAIVGAYRDINAVWMKIWRIPENKRSWWEKIVGNDSTDLSVHFYKAAITINKMD